MDCKRRERWTNHTGNQFIEPLRICEPSSLDELVALVRQAEAERVTIRAVGSGHSWSDVALTTGYLLRPTKLTRLLGEPDALHPQVDTAQLVRVEGGIRIRELNAQLAERDLALVQMGGYDGQTIAGVMATATHGSGIEFGPLCDWVRSLDVVGSGGQLWRIEPSQGITDPTLYKDGRLIQDDTWFHAALVGMGSLGIVYSLTLEVREAFLLKEERRLSTWEELAPKLDAELAANEHLEVYITPYERHGRHRVIVTTRNQTDQEPAPGPGRRRNALTEILAGSAPVQWLIQKIVNLRPGIAPLGLDLALGGLKDREYVNVSYKVFNIGRANDNRAYSSEIGVPLARIGEAVQRIFTIAERHAEQGSVYHTSPISLRPVKASPALMAMQYGEPTVMIELIQLVETHGGYELLAAYEDELYELGGRPHWGQFNTLTDDDERLAKLYPRYADWRAVRDELAGSGVFDAPFTKRVGISPTSTLARPEPAS